MNTTQNLSHTGHIDRKNYLPFRLPSAILALDSPHVATAVICKNPSATADFQRFQIY